jgi:hypothetical protein
MSSTPRNGRTAGEGSGAAALPMRFEVTTLRLLAAAGTAGGGWSRPHEGTVMTAEWPVPAGPGRASNRLSIQGELPAFDGVTGWLTSTTRMARRKKMRHGDLDQ